MVSWTRGQSVGGGFRGCVSRLIWLQLPVCCVFYHDRTTDFEGFLFASLQAEGGHVFICCVVKLRRPPWGWEWTYVVVIQLVGLLTWSAQCCSLSSICRVLHVSGYLYQVKLVKCYIYVLHNLIAHPSHVLHGQQVVLSSGCLCGVLTGAVAWLGNVVVPPVPCGLYWAYVACCDLECVYWSVSTDCV